MADFTMTRRAVLGAATATSVLALKIGNLQAAPSGGVLNAIAFPEPPTLFIGLDQNGPTQLVAGKIYESLLTYDFDFKPMPGLAKSWEITENGLNYVFRLQDGVKWHDGAPFTAEDVVFSIKDFLMEVHPRARAIFQNCDVIEALDPLTVRFHLKNPFAPFMIAFEMSTTPIVPAHLYKGTNFRTNPNNAKPVGTGPFKLEEWRKGAFIKLVRNAEYYIKDQPNLDEIYFHIIPDAASRAVAVEQKKINQVQSVDLEPLDAIRLQDAPHLQKINRGFEFYGPVVRIELNNRIAPFDDKRFRQAINYAIDKKFVRDNIFFGLGKEATGPISSRTRFYDSKVKRYDQDLAKARALLDEMGLKPGANGIRTKISLLRLPLGDNYLRLAEYIKQALQRIGLEVELESADFAGWTSRYGNWDFQMTINLPYQFGDPALGVARFFISSNIRKGVPFSNTTGYVNPKIDELFAKGSETIVEAERQAIYSEIQRILLEDVPMVWMFEPERPVLIDKRFDDCVVTAIGVNETYRRARKVA